MYWLLLLLHVHLALLEMYFWLVEEKRYLRQNHNLLLEILPIIYKLLKIRTNLKCKKTKETN